MITVDDVNGSHIFTNLQGSRQFIKSNFDNDGDYEVDRIYQSDAEGSEIPNGKEYGCNWNLTLEQI